MNTPYVKQMDPTTGLEIPLTESYISVEPNRRQRRQHLNRPPLHGNNKGVHLTVLKTGKYKRVYQHETDKHGNKKTIEHYILQS